MDELEEKKLFFEALDTDSLILMQQVSKSDLHNHVGRGGSQDYLASNKGVTITPSSTLFNSLKEMQSWFENNIKMD